jgi:hypothetical protein
MAHSTENAYRWRDTAVARASDDFYPTDTSSHRPHLAACAYNGLFLGALALPDWDMFHSRHSAAALHAAARAVSGGPVYVSDAPGAHGFELLRSLVLPDGAVLRARLPGRPTRDTLFADVMRDGATAQKVWNLNAATGVVCVMNIQGSAWDRAKRRFVVHAPTPPALVATVRVADVEPFARAARARAAAGAAARRRSPDSPLALLTVAARAIAAGGGGGGDASEATAPAASSGYDSDVSSEGGAASARPAANGNGANGNGGNGAAAPLASADADAEAAPAAAGAIAAGASGAAFGGGSWAMYVSTTRQVHRVDSDGGVRVSVAPGQAAVVTIARVRRAGGVEFAPLGLANMLNGGGAITYVRAALGGGAWADATDSAAAPAAPRRGGAAPRFALGLRGRGTLVAAASAAPAAVRLAGAPAPHAWHAGVLEVQVGGAGAPRGGINAFCQGQAQAAP